MKKLYIIAPNDRFNYGDLLFTHILHKALSQYVDECIYVSTTSSDLSSLGGVKTVSFQQLYSASPSDDNILIVAGGESLCVGWGVILSFIDRTFDKISSLAFRCHISRLTQAPTNFIFKKIYGAKTKYPFSIGKNELPQFSRVFYNSLGGCDLYSNPKRLNKRTREILSSVDHLAVRDKYTYEALINQGINASLHPDSAILMREVFNEDVLLSHLTIEKSHFTSQDYIFVQTCPLKQDKTKKIAKFLQSIYYKYKRKIILCPIGTALGHNNDAALAAIAEYMDKDSYILVKDINLWTIMWLIKHSKLYVGTSLHGAITAMSFGVPLVTHGQPKVKAYLDTWAPDIQESYGDFSTLFERIESQILSPKVCDTNQQIDSIKQSLGTMTNMINNRSI